ncbi:MAG: V-type ATPase 116kDa subunit family protein, partial [Parachlamydiaceae bacterium]
LLVNAIKVLRGQPVVDQEETEEFDIALGLAQKIVSIRDSLKHIEEEERLLNLEISRVAVFGNFSQQDIDYIENATGRKIQFYCAKHGHAEHNPLPDELLLVNSSHGLEYYMGINPQSMQYPKMIEMEISRPLGDLQRRQHELHKEKYSLETRLKGYAKYNEFMHKALIEQMNQYHLDEANGFVEFPLEAGKLFVVQGWVPTNKVKEMHAFVEQMDVQVEEIAINPREEPPTCLENEGVARIGEDLVHIYDTPSSRDKDPSLWVLVFFSLFFAMIIDDGAYGLVFLLVALYIRRKHAGLKGAKKRFVDLIAILGFSCIAWGILMTSFFGIHFAPDNPMHKFSLMSWMVEKKAEYHITHADTVYHEWVKKVPALAGVKNPQEFLMKAAEPNAHGGMKYEAFEVFADNILLELALLLGVIHIVLSMCRNLSRNWAYIGWIILIIGGYLYAPSFLNAVGMPNYILGISKELTERNGLYMIYTGLITGVILAGCQHKIIGILETTVVIQIFGDILSYLRLYALGLSGAMLASTLADLAASVPLVFGIMILVVGHIINIALGVMGGVIHGLRLNFLEWYHYCFEGGGKVFRPLKKHEVE